MTKKKEENNSKQTTAKPPKEEKTTQKPQHKATGGFAKGNVRDRLKEQVEPFIGEIGVLLMRVQKEEGTNEMLQRMKDFMPYFMPKYQSMSLNTDNDRPISEEQRLTELDAMYTKKELSINFKSMTMINNDKLHANDPEADEDDFDLSVFDTIDN